MSSSPLPLARREFLVVTSLSTIAAALFGPPTFASTVNRQRARLAIGVAPFDRGGELQHASSAVAPDGAFIGRGARVSIVGARGVGDRPASRRIVDVVTRFRYFDGGQRRVAPFRAWASNRVNGAEGGRTSFVVPVDVEQNLDLAVVLESDVETVTLPVVLSLQGDGPGLVRGHYVLVPLFDAESAPDWSAYVLQDGAVVDRSGAPAAFEHFLIAIDYGM